MVGCRSWREVNIGMTIMEMENCNWSLYARGASERVSDWLIHVWTWYHTRIASERKSSIKLIGNKVICFKFSASDICCLELKSVAVIRRIKLVFKLSYLCTHVDDKWEKMAKQNVQHTKLKVKVLLSVTTFVRFEKLCFNRHCVAKKDKERQSSVAQRKQSRENRTFLVCVLRLSSSKGLVRHFGGFSPTSG